MNGGKKMISPSMMCAGIDKLTQTLRVFEEQKIEHLHIDVMDGSFVPNFTLGTDYCRQLRTLTSIPLDIHLMINGPENKIPWFNVQPGDIVSVHAESTKHFQKALAAVRAAGGQAFAALNPATPVCFLEEVMDDLDGVLVMCVNPGFAGQKLIPSTLEKIRRVRAFLDANGRTDALIEADGNVSFENAARMKDAGADIFVAGTSSIFSPELTLNKGIEKLREIFLL